MKKTRSAKPPGAAEDELSPEYRFDYKKARPNRYAARVTPGSRAILLDADVAEVFRTPESVNSVLRALIESMPERSPK